MSHPHYSVVTDKGQEIPVEIMRFPSGEVNVKLDVKRQSTIKLINRISVFVQGYEPDTLFILGCIKNAIDEIALRSDVKPKVYLFMPFTPHARYDRHMVDGDSFALRVFADMLNLLHFDRVIVADPHSDKVTALIKNCVTIPQQAIMAEMITKFDIQFDVLVAPDEGAAKKIFALAEIVNRPVVTMSKVRDLATGKITGLRLIDFLPEGEELRCLIVDDLCDGGRTFIEASKVLHENGAAHVSLAVTHGIFSQGTLALIHKGVEDIYVTDSFGNLDVRNEHPHVHVFKYF